jgi:7-carboxy-7-deazaguanine synthase
MSDLGIQYPLMEHFYTIQGEGKYSGRAAYFLRIGGCDVGCVWCDVKESWDKNLHPETSIDAMLRPILESKTDFVVITGGEPAMYDLNPLVNALHANNIYVAIETSGAYEVMGDIDWFCLSPKKFKMPVDSAYKSADEFKVVIYHPSDFEWAEKQTALLRHDCELFLQPEWSKTEQLLPKIIDYVKQNPKWRISLQTHKFMNIP